MKIKLWNRKTEFLLHEVDFIVALNLIGKVLAHSYVAVGQHVISKFAKNVDIVASDGHYDQICGSWC